MTDNLLNEINRLRPHYLSRSAIDAGRRWMTFGWAIGRDVGPENHPDAWMPIPSARLPNKEDRNG